MTSAVKTILILGMNVQRSLRVKTKGWRGIRNTQIRSISRAHSANQSQTNKCRSDNWDWGKTRSLDRQRHHAIDHCKGLTQSKAQNKYATMAAASVEEKPLLAETQFPLYDAVKADQVVPCMKELLGQLNQQLDDLEKDIGENAATLSWEQIVVPLEKIVDKLSRTWGVITHLKAVCDTEELRKAVEEVQPEQVAFSLRLSQSEKVYRGFKALKESSDWDNLEESRKRIVLENIRDAELSGVALEGDSKKRFNEIQQELSKLSTKFSNNTLDGTKRFSKTITDKKEIEGLPESALALAAQTAVSKGTEDATAESGPWILTLDIPSYLPVMLHAKNRSLREELYKAYLSRASSDDIDNTPVIARYVWLSILGLEM